MGRDDRRVARGCDVEIVRVSETGDVIPNDCARVAGGVEHRRAPRVDRNGNVESFAQGRDGRNDSFKLLGLGDVGSGTGLHTADIEQIGTVGDQFLSSAQERIETPSRATIVERVGRAIENPHDERAGADVEALLTDSNRRRRRVHRAEATEAAYRTVSLSRTV